MKQFVGKLWANPTIKNAPIVKKENQILSFIKENSEPLKTALSGPDYFPDLSFEEIIKLMYAELTDKIITALEPRMDAILNAALDPALIAFFRSEGIVLQIDAAKLRNLIISTMQTKAMRDHYTHTFEALSYRLFERYTPIILNQHKVIYFEMIRRDRLNMDSSIVCSLLNLISLFRPLYHWKFPRNIAGQQQLLNIAAVSKDARMYESMLKELGHIMQQEAGSVPDLILRNAMDSWLDANEKTLSGLSRYVSIMMNRAAEYDPMQKHDRGAETPDKSWFNINRRSARYYGYDARFLEELYQIAGGEGW